MTVVIITGIAIVLSTLTAFGMWCCCAVSGKTDNESDKYGKG